MLAPAVPTPAPTTLDLIWESIITPGSTPGLLRTINITLVTLILCLLYFCTTYVYTVHLLIMASLSAFLLVGINLFADAVSTASRDCVERKDPKVQ